MAAPLDVEELPSSWRFRDDDGAVIEIGRDGTILLAPSEDRRIVVEDRFAYWDDLLLRASDWLASEQGVGDLRLADGLRYDPSVLALERAVPRPAAQRPDFAALALAHHLPEQYERCALIGGRHVCRRCLILYPLCVAVAVVSYLAAPDPARFDWAIAWLVPLPATIEFVGEALGWWRYSKWRQVAVMVPLAAAFGRGLGRYFADPGDRLFWAVLVVFCLVWGGAAIAGHRRRQRQDRLATVAR